jgi:Zn-dependent M28 family amino/carboxypeptidase
VTILEAFRVILQSDDILKGKHENTLEFHWYSAEEGGLLGSQAIFSAYEKQGRDVKAMLQQDMTGFVTRTLDAGKPESVGVIVDFVDPSLTEYIKKIIVEVCCIHPLSPNHNTWLTRSKVLRHPLRRDQVRVRLLRPRLGIQGRVSLGLRHRVCVRVLGQPHPLY